MQATLTELLVRAQKGDSQAWDECLPLIYPELRRIAAAHLRRERPGHILQPTALLHEVWLKLAYQSGITIQNRAHFFALCSRTMRRVLIDESRRPREFSCLMKNVMPGVPPDDLAIALSELEEVAPRQCRVLEMHYFGGLTYREIAAELNISDRTVKRECFSARVWIYRYIRPWTP